MNSKPRIYAAPGSNAALPWQSAYWQQYFDIIPFGVDFDDNSFYDDGRTALIANYTDIDQYKYIQLPLINDHLIDSGPMDPSEVVGGILELQGAHWMRISEQWLGIYNVYNQPRPQDRPTKFFLMPMNQQRRHRDWLFEDTKPYRNKSIWSYVQKGVILPGDDFVPTKYHVGVANDRLYRSEWYAKTCFSLVSESTMDTTGSGYGKSSLFISEKSFKPLAYRHPFVIQGTALTLEYLKSLGFATYQSEMNESYDKIFSARMRHNAVIDLIQQLFNEFNLHGTVLQSASAKEIAQHNYDHFWNRQLVMQLFEQYIVQPIMEFVESK